MFLIWTLIIGLIVGAGATLITPGKDPGGILITTAFGVAGSDVGAKVGLGFNIPAFVPKPIVRKLRKNRQPVAIAVAS